jgi:hypothetical protein
MKTLPVLVLLCLVACGGSQSEPSVEDTLAKAEAQLAVASAESEKARIEYDIAESKVLTEHGRLK